jgi:hypothetical protein
LIEEIEDQLDLQYFLQAISYFCAASLAWENRPTPDTLIAPVTQIVGHGVELTLKANLLLQGSSEKDIRNIGHDLKALWQHERNSGLRDRAYEIAKGSHSFTQASFEKRVETLSSLYFAGRGNFPLRYEAVPELTSSHSPQFVDTFTTIAKMGVGTSIENLKRNENLKDSALKLEKNFQASVWSKWRPRI